MSQTTGVLVHCVHREIVVNFLRTFYIEGTSTFLVHGTEALGETETMAEECHP